MTNSIWFLFRLPLPPERVFFVPHLLSHSCEPCSLRARRVPAQIKAAGNLLSAMNYSRFFHACHFCVFCAWLKLHCTGIRYPSHASFIGIESFAVPSSIYRVAKQLRVPDTLRVPFTILTLLPYNYSWRLTFIILIVCSRRTPYLWTELMYETIVALWQKFQFISFSYQPREVFPHHSAVSSRLVPIRFARNALGCCCCFCSDAAQVSRHAIHRQSTHRLMPQTCAVFAIRPFNRPLFARFL